MIRTATCALLAAFLFAGCGEMKEAQASDAKIGNCELVGPKGSIPIANPAKAGQLTVEVSLPAPTWWNGDTPEAIKDGMEYCLAAEIAYRAGFEKMEVINVGWDPLVTGQTSGFDLALSEISITDERKKVVDFSIPYFSSDIGVLTRSDKGDMFTALRAGQIDAAITDTSIVLAEEVRGDGKVKVPGQYKTGESYGALYPKGGANNATIDKIIQAIIDDGTMKKLGQKWLASVWGKDPADLPVWNP
jgi:polar amino acid transport system substrate-binding protein